MLLNVVVDDVDVDVVVPDECSMSTILLILLTSGAGCFSGYTVAGFAFFGC